MTIVLHGTQIDDATLSQNQATPAGTPLERTQPVVDIKFVDDISIVNGDIALVQEPDASGQRIRHRLLTFKGEWFLDLGFGPDYRGQVFVKNPRIEVVSALIRSEIIKSAKGTFTGFEAAFNNAARSLTVGYKLQMPQGTVSDTITI